MKLDLLTVVVVTPPTVSYDKLSFQRPDGLETLRDVPVLRHFVPPDQNEVVRFVGRRWLSEMTILSDADIPLGVKFNLDVGDRVYLGCMAVSYALESKHYTCTVDHIEHKEKQWQTH